MKKYILSLICLILIFIFQVRTLPVEGKEFEEYEVKAVFLVNFIKFVEWPKQDRDGGHYRICMYGNDVFGQYTGNIERMKVRGKALKVRRISSLRNLGDCNILFVSPSERRRIHSILEAVRDEDVVTVGDTDGYAKEGVMINFYIEARKVKFEINLNSIRRARINVSSQLLKLGRMVDHD
ncbi:MAG: YfiR family protein [Syntrophorhabdaceae bacterium]